MRREVIGDATLYCGDCRDVLETIAPSSVDSIVTDPPYGLKFMGKAWDHGVPGVEFWTSALRVAKPGAHLLAFGGTRTFHRLICAIEDAGWEIRDLIGWVYGSGFPKSLDVSKAIDKDAGAEREVVGQWKPTGNARKSNIPGHGAAVSNSTENRIFKNDLIPITAPATEAAKQWQGWGTALKPAWEPICLARKPLVGTVAGNVLRFGTGAINVDGCRVGDDEMPVTKSDGTFKSSNGSMSGHNTGRIDAGIIVGRWPANILHDGSDEVVALFPVEGEESAARFFYTAKASREDRDEGLDEFDEKNVHNFREDGRVWDIPGSHSTHRRNIHPTVKPTDLMRYLVRLVTPPGGTCLDMFMGSGSTGKACKYEGFPFIGIDLEDAHVDIAKARIQYADKKAREQPDLFKVERQPEREEPTLF